jgi:perosamine synthetase
MRKKIPLSVPSLQGNEWAYVKECLDTEWISSAGKYVETFEARLAAFVGSPHAVACVNGTAALQVALKIVGVKPGEEVIVPTLTFIATINALSYLDAVPVFMDCDDFYNIDVEKTTEFLDRNTEFRAGATYNKSSGRRIAAIVPVHVFGNAVALQGLVERCRKGNIRVVEDATEALGTRYRGDAGKHSGTLGDIGCFSFNGNKIITTGGGGMIVTASAEYATRARYLTTQAKDDEVRYVHNEVGYNFRLTNVQAAIGVAQLEQLPGFLETKRRNYDRYARKLASVAGLKLAPGPGYADNNLWMYALQIDPSTYGQDRETLMKHLRERDIETRPVWYLNHLQVPFLGRESYRIEKAPHLLDITLNIPCSSNLKDEDVDYVADQLRNG